MRSLPQGSGLALLSDDNFVVVSVGAAEQGTGRVGRRGWAWDNGTHREWGEENREKGAERTQKSSHNSERTGVGESAKVVCRLDVHGRDF